MGAELDAERIDRVLAVLRRHGVVEFSGAGFSVKLALFVPQPGGEAQAVSTPEHTQPDKPMRVSTTEPQRITADDVFGGA